MTWGRELPILDCCVRAVGFGVSLGGLGSLEQVSAGRDVISLLETEFRRVPLPVNAPILAVAACEVGRDLEALLALDRQPSTPIPFDPKKCLWLGMTKVGPAGIEPATDGL
jgi:hypothetical protein